MVLLIELIILVLLFIRKRQYILYSIYAIVIVSFISFVMPFANYEALSIRNQVNYIENILKNKSISELDNKTKKI